MPWLRLDADGRTVVDRQMPPAAGRSATAEPILDALLGDPPLRPDGVHLLAGTGQAVRAVVIPGADGRRDLLLMPLNGAEISGLVPDHFLEELPVALARLEPERPAHLRQPRRPPAPRRPRPAGRQHRRR